MPAVEGASWTMTGGLSPPSAAVMRLGRSRRSESTTVFTAVADGISDDMPKLTLETEARVQNYEAVFRPEE